MSGESDVTVTLLRSVTCLPVIGSFNLQLYDAITGGSEPYKRRRRRGIEVRTDQKIKKSRTFSMVNM